MLPYGVVSDFGLSRPVRILMDPYGLESDNYLTIVGAHQDRRQPYRPVRPSVTITHKRTPADARVLFYTYFA